MKAYRLYPSVKRAWDNNYHMIKNDMGDVYVQLYAYLLKYRKSYFRFNVAGDILNDVQFFMYKKLARKFPHIQFLSFTKNYDLRFTGIPDNYNVILSTWKGLKLPRNNTLPRAYISTDTKRIPLSSLKCAGSCKECQLCWHLEKGESVTFDIH